jgi:peptidoglycan hydrolase CwlO-like protein
MKKTLAILMTTSLFAVAVPVFAAESHQHGATQQLTDEECAKECDMLIRNCTNEVLDIHSKIKKLQSEINDKGATKYTVEELKILEKKLKDAKDTLKTLQKPH